MVVLRIGENEARRVIRRWTQMDADVGAKNLSPTFMGDVNRLLFMNEITEQPTNFLRLGVVFFILGLGQLLQGRLLIALFQFFLAALLWLVWMGWLIHL